MAPLKPVFLDTSVFVGASLDPAPDRRAQHAVMDFVHAGRVRNAVTSWHCCLEFFSVVTRLPTGYRLSGREAAALVETAILGNVRLVSAEHAGAAFFRRAAEDGAVRGRVYDYHIAEEARASEAVTVITENPRDFGALGRSGVAVVSSAQFVASLQSR